LDQLLPEIVAGTIVALISAIIAYYLGGVREKQRRLAEQQRFALDLRDQFAKYDDVHYRLRPGGEWAGATGGPATPKEWSQVEAYMGLFEQCELMIEHALIDESTFKELYAYRLNNIAANETIRREKLIKRAEGWAVFLALLKRMQIEVNSQHY
jgi:hypothetical protein